MRNEGFKHSIKDVRNRFNVGDLIDIVLRLAKDGQAYRIQGRARIIGKYDDYILIEKSGYIGEIRECISYKEIHSKDVKVVVVRC